MGRGRRASLKRRKASKDTPARIVIVCEGERTEPDYFRALKRHITCRALIDIKIVQGINSPNRVAKRAVEECMRERKNRGRYAGDQFWAVFDRDQDVHYYEAIALCEQRGIGVARSNPCFELWLILHCQDYDRAEKSKKLQKEYERIVGGAYHHKKGKTMDFSPLMNNLAKAERRAERQFKRRQREASPDGTLPPPYTTVFQLTRAIKAAAAK